MNGQNHIKHRIISSKVQIETWWWSCERAETCSLINKYYTTLLVVFDCTTLYLHSHSKLNLSPDRDSKPVYTI